MTLTAGRRTARGSRLLTTSPPGTVQRECHPAVTAEQGSPADRVVGRRRRGRRRCPGEPRALLTNRHILQIQAELERNDAGFRKLPGTALKDGGGRTVYTPPQDPADIVALMGDLERFINDDALFDADPLIKMALIHHQFESIHPFYDGNGRTGRIINVLYLVKHGLLDIPVLYLSRHIVRDQVRVLPAAAGPCAKTTRGRTGCSTC